METCTKPLTIIYLSEERLRQINQQPNQKFELASRANEKEYGLR